MKKKMLKILGVGLTLVMAVSLIAAFAAPVAAAEEAWDLFAVPAEDAASDWFMGDSIAGLGPMAKAIDGTLYLYMDNAAVSPDIIDDLFKSTDEGRTWEATGYKADLFAGGTVTTDPIVDIACSTDDADVLYVATTTNVYKSDDAGAAASWSDLGTMVSGTEVINCLAVGYADDDPHLFVGTEDPTAGLGEVWYYRDAPFAAVWTDLDVCAPDSGLVPVEKSEVYGIAVSPDFENDTLVVAVITGDTDASTTTDATYVTANVGAGIGINNWDDLQLLDDTTPTPGSYVITEAANPVFVEDFDIDDAYELFVGVSGAAHAAPGSTLGGVYRITGRTDADDFLLDDVDDDIASLDAVGILGAASLLAGTTVTSTAAVTGPGSIWYSTDDGDSWSETDKAPTGLTAAVATDTVSNLVIVDDDFADNGIAWCASDVTAGGQEGGVHLTTDFGATWNGISMIDTDMTTAVYDIAFSADYGTGDAPMFMVTQSSIATADDSVWKYDGTNWERVWYDTANELNLVEVSPAFADDEALFIAASVAPTILYSHNGGATFTEMIRQPAAIKSWVVIDDETVITGDANGDYYKTTRYGRRIWDTDAISPAGDTITSLAISPDFANDHTVLAGDGVSLVYISTDDGEAWDEVSASDIAGFTTNDEATYVAFDTRYADNNFIYAASDDVVARCEIDPDVDWADQEFTDFAGAGTPPGLTPGVGPGGIVVSDDGTQAGESVATLYVSDANATGGMWRCLNPAAALADVIFENPVPATALEFTPVVGVISNLELSYGSNILYAIDTAVPAGAIPDVIWTYEDTLAAPAVLTSPADEARLKDTARVEFEWEALNADTVNWYQIWVNEEADFPAGTDEEIGTSAQSTETIGASTAVDIHDGTTLVWRLATPGTEYYWKVRVSEGGPVLSRWSVARTLFTKVAAVTEPIAVRPLPGAQDIILMPTFAWHEVTGAASYDIEIAPTAAFTAGVIRGMSPINAWQIDTELEYSTTYYWRVRGISASGAPAGDWVVSVFTTMAEPVPAPPPVVVEPTPPPVVEVPAPEMITPNWIYAIIGIGAALAIVVIVLIVRTRRAP